MNMKNLSSLLIVLLLTCVSVSSCLKDNGGATATVNYYGFLDSIRYTNTADTVWTRNIVEAMYKLKVTETEIVASDTALSGFRDDAIYMCNAKAGKTYDEMLNKITLDDVKREIYKAHADSLIKLGYNEGSEKLPLSRFKIFSSLWSGFYRSAPVFLYEKDIR